MGFPELDAGDSIYRRDPVARTVWCLAAVLGVAALTVPVDVPLTLFLHKASRSSKVLQELAVGAEFIGRGVGVAMILGAVAMSDQKRRRYALSTYLLVFGAGLAANIVKIMTVRIRPRDLNLHRFGSWQTFRGPLHLTETPLSHLSFPSGHTATAFALAYVFSRYYPKGRPMFLVIAACSGIGRIVVKAHYPSDVIAGAVLGWGFGCLVSGILFSPDAWTAAWSQRFKQRQSKPEPHPKETVAAK